MTSIVTSYTLKNRKNISRKEKELKEEKARKRQQVLTLAPVVQVTRVEAAGAGTAAATPSAAT